jgi:hypothetical protein
METGQLDWRRANAEVGQFPRGHADIVKWESQVDAVVPGAGTAPAPAQASPPVLSAPPPQHLIATIDSFFQEQT